MLNKNIKKLSLWLALIALVCIAGAVFLFFQIDVRAYKDNQIYINEEKIFAVEDIKNINIDSFSANVNLIETSDNNVKVHIYGKIYSKDKDNSNGPKAELENGKLVIKEKGKSNISIGINLDISDFFDDNEVKIDLFLPKTYNRNLVIDSSSGHIKGESFNLKELKVNTFSGDIKFSGITSDKAGFETSSGKIDVGNIKTGELKINTFSGDEYFGNIYAENIYAETSSGRVSLGQVEAKKAEWTTFSGDMAYDSLKASEATFDTSSGKISIGSGVLKKIKCETFSGDIKFGDTSFEDFNIKSSSGSVTLKLIDSSGFNLNAESSSGKVICDIDIKNVNKKSEHDIKGIVGNGSGTLKISTFSGDIKIIK